MSDVVQDRINLGLVPKTSRGQIDYSVIPSAAVRLLVVEEEIRNLRKKLDRYLKTLESPITDKEYQRLSLYKRLVIRTKMADELKRLIGEQVA